MSLLTPEAWSARMTMLVPTCRGLFWWWSFQGKKFWCQNIFHAYPPAPCPSPAPSPWPAALFWTCSPWSSRWGSLLTHSQSGAGAWNCREPTDEDEKSKDAPCQAKEPTRRHEAITPVNFCMRVRILFAEAILHSDALGPEELCTVYDQPGNIIMVIPAKIISDKT